MKTTKTRPNEAARKDPAYKPPMPKQQDDGDKVLISELIARRRHMSGLMCPPSGAVPESRRHPD